MVSATTNQYENLHKLSQILAQTWHQRKNHLDLPCRKAPVELFRQGLACGGGNEKSPSKSVNLEGLCGPRWARTGPTVKKMSGGHF